jgi:hypothetical protein
MTSRLARSHQSARRDAYRRRDRRGDSHLSILVRMVILMRVSESAIGRTRSGIQSFWGVIPLPATAGEA